MQQWYINKMKEAKTHKSAKDYAEMAKITVKELMTIRYLEEPK